MAVKKKVVKTVKKAASKKVKKPVSKTVKKAAAKTVKKPAVKTVKKTVEKTVKKPAAKTVKKAAVEVVVKPVPETVKSAVIETVTDDAVVSGKGAVTDALLIKYAIELGALLEEKKAEKITLLDLRKVNSFLDYFVICTGNSHAHLRSMSKEIQRFFSGKGIKLRGLSDLSEEWIILDYSEIVIHLFSAEARGYYDLDKLWSDAVKL